MSVASIRKLSSFTRLFRIMGLLRGETASRVASPSQGKMKSFPPELAQAMERSARRAKENNIDIEEPIEGDLGF